MLSFITKKTEYEKFAQSQNAKKQKVFALALSIICFLLLVDNEVPVLPLHLEETLTYYNISLIFCGLFLFNWVVLKVCDHFPKTMELGIWWNIMSCMVFVHTLSILELTNGHGLTVLAIGIIMLAVVVSANYLTMISLIIGHNLYLYIQASQLPGLDISIYKMIIIALTMMGILVFITVERQRRKVFETQQMLSAKVDELNKALDVKSIYFGHMSHELRTPLNAILGFSEMILTDTYNPKTVDKIKEYVKLIHTGGSHLLNIVNDILDSSKLEAGEVETKLERVNLKSTLEDYIKELDSITIDKKQNVRLVVEQEDTSFNTDRRLLKQIIFNLISNAQKYTSIGGLIEVLVVNNGTRQIDIIVKDNGKGMDLRQLNAINNGAKSNDSHFIARAEGTGLGLVIVKQLVKLLEGTIEFYSAPGAGTEIKMSFPA